MQLPASPPISIVILTRNRQVDILTAVGSALAQDYPEFEVVVIDNGSEPSPLDELRARFGGDPRLRLFDSRVNLGASGGRNHGVKMARYDLITYIDDDSRFLRNDTLRYIGDFFSARPDAGALQLDIVDPTGEIIYEWRGPVTDPSDPAVTEVNFLVTCGCAVTRRAHELAGGFPEDYIVFYEDNYYALAIIRANLRVFRTSARQVEHPNPNLQTSRKQPFVYRMLARNIQWLYFEFFPLRETLRVVPFHLYSYLKRSLRDGGFSGWRQGLIEGMRMFRTLLRDRPKLTPSQYRYVRSLDRP